MSKLYTQNSQLKMVLKFDIIIKYTMPTRIYTTICNCMIKNGRMRYRTKFLHEK